MTRITIEETALDAIAAMGKRLQEERDELLEVAKKANKFLANLAKTGGNWTADEWSEVQYPLYDAIAKCTAEPDILEGKQ